MATNAIGSVEANLLKLAGGTGVQYILEMRGLRNDTFAVVPLPSQPSDVQCTRDYHELPMYTFGGATVFREIAKQRTGSITIKGNSGLYSRLGIRYNYDSLFKDTSIKEDLKDILTGGGNGVFYANGEEHMTEFQKFLQKYHFYAANSDEPVVYSAYDLKNGLETDRRPFLVFRALAENLHVKVCVTDFTWQKSTGGNRLSYAWTLTLRIYDDYEPENPFTFFGDYLKQVNRAIQNVNGSLFLLARIPGAVSEQLLSPVDKVVKQLRNSIKGVEAVAVSPIALMENMKYTVRNMQKTVNQLRVSVTNVGDSYEDAFGEDSFKYFVDGWWASIRETPSDIGDAATGDVDIGQQDNALREQSIIIEDLLRNLSIASGYLNLIDKNRRAYVDINTGFLDREDTSWALLGSLYRETDFVRKNVRPRVQGVRYILRAGENLINIAEKLLADKTKWTILATINECKDAYTRSSGEPLKTGDEILVPTTTENNVLLPLLPNTLKDNTLSTGTDLLLDDTGDLVLGDQDLKLVSGKANLKQAITNVLQTGKGELIMNPEFGLTKIVGYTNIWGANFIAAQIREQLLYDARFLDVQDVNIELQGDTLVVTLTVSTINKEKITFTTGV
jgi:hypothetical protein